MKKLAIAETLKLPLDAATETLVIYGGKGMGKTNLTVVLAEEFSAAGLRFAILDPMGVYWGLRYSKDGKGPGISVLILGGIHGDIPIEPTAGEVVADLVADEDVDVIVDISRRPNGRMWTKGEKIRFVAKYMTRLYERQGERRRPLMQMIDECARFAPQAPRSGDNDSMASLDAIATATEEGRNVGLGVCLITQRSARMAKAVSELAEVMFAFRTVGPLSVGAVTDWLGDHIDKERHKDMTSQLRKLPRGSALVVSPGWLEFEGVVAMRERRTFDSSATPKVGQREQHATGKGAALDLGRYQERMAATIEKMKADDPKELRKRIAELTAELSRVANKPPQVAPAPEKAIDLRPQLEEAARAATAAAERRFRALITGYELKLTEIQDACTALSARFQEAMKPLAGVPKIFYLNEQHELPLQKQIPAPAAPPVVREKRTTGTGDIPWVGSTVESSDGSLSKVERAFLMVLAQRIAKKTTRNQLAIFAHYSARSRHVDNSIGKLRSKGMLAGDGDLYITDAGMDAIGEVEPLPTGEELQRYWMAKVGTAPGAMLRELIKVYPETLTRDQVAALAGYSVSSRHVDNCLGLLRSMDLIEGRPDLKASADLFE